MQEQNSISSTENSVDEVKVQAKNFAELRAIAEASKQEAISSKQENIQLKQKLTALEETVNRLSSKEEISDEPYIDSATFQRRLDKEKENIKRESKEEMRNEWRKVLEEEKRAQYLEKNSDFFEVMQAEKIQQFINENPEMARELEELPDNFSRQKVVYRSIKKSLEQPKVATKAPETPKSLLAQAFESRKAQMAYAPGGSSGGPFQSTGDFSQGGMKAAYDKYKALQKTINMSL